MPQTDEAGVSPGFSPGPAGAASFDLGDPAGEAGRAGAALGGDVVGDDLVEAGYAALVIDDCASRSVDDDTVPCGIMVSNVTHLGVVTDASSGLKALNRHPAIDPTRIGVMVFSQGGIATRHARDQRLKDSHRERIALPPDAQLWRSNFWTSRAQMRRPSRMASTT